MKSSNITKGMAVALTLLFILFTHLVNAQNAQD